MDDVHKELDELKTEMEKIKEDYRIKTDLCDSLRRAHNEQLIKLQEAKSEIEKQAQVLNAKADEISLARQMYDDLNISLREKESVILHLKLANDKIRENSAETLHKLEGENRELLSALDEANIKSKDHEEKILVYRQEIDCLQGLLSVSEKKHHEADKKAQVSKELRQRDDLLQDLDDKSRRFEEQLKWKKEQFQHLEEAHGKLKDEYRKSKREWEQEKSMMLDEISSLQTSLDSQTRISQDLQSRLQMCNQALAHEESRRKILEVQLSESKTCYDNVVMEHQEAKSKIEDLAIQRDKEVAALRNALGKKESFLKEMEFKTSHLEQDNQELQRYLKELREDQIKTGAASSMTKLRNKFKNLEQLHKQCSKNLKTREAEWNSQMDKMNKEMNDIRTELNSKNARIEELHVELEDCNSSMLQLMLHNEELSVMVTLLHSGISEACIKLGNVTVEMELLEHTEQIAHLTEQSEKKNMLVEAHAKIENECKKEASLMMGNGSLNAHLTEQSEKKNMLVEAHAKVEKESKKEASLATGIEPLDLFEQQKLVMQNELQRCKEMLEESVGCQLLLKEEALQMQNALTEDLRKVSEAFDTTNSELAEKIHQSSEIEFELERWKDLAGRLKSCVDENQEIRREMEHSLLAQVEIEQALKLEKENLLRIVEEKDKKLDALDQQIVSLREQVVIKEAETSTMARIETEKALLEKENLFQVVEEKEKSIGNLKTEIACLVQEFLERELEGTILAHIEAEKAFEEERDTLLHAAKEKEKNLDNLQRLITSMKNDSDRLEASFVSGLAEKEAEVDILREAWEKTTASKLLVEVEIQEKNLLIVELEGQISNLLQKLESQEKYLSNSKQVLEQLEAALQEKQSETETLMGQLLKVKTSEGLIEELKSEKSLFVSDIMRLSSEKEELKALIGVLWDRINQFSKGDAELMGRLEMIVQSFDQQTEVGKDLPLDDEIYDPNQENVGATFASTAKRVEVGTDGRLPLKEFNTRMC